MSIAEERRRAATDPNGFWAEAAVAIELTRPPEAALSREPSGAWRWFAGCELNTCHNALDRHVESGRGEQVALIHDSPVTGTIRSYTFRALRDEVARFAGVLVGLGVARATGS
jgi:propionyl-CoA synthetase